MVSTKNKLISLVTSLVIESFIFKPFRAVDSLFFVALVATYLGQNHQEVRQEDIVDRLKIFSIAWAVIIRTIVFCGSFVIIWYHLYGLIRLENTISFQESIYLIGMGSASIMVGIAVIAAFHDNDANTN